MVTRDEVYHTLSYKDWKCAHEVNDKLNSTGTASLEKNLIAEYVQNQPEVVLSTIEKYLTTFVHEKVAEYRKRTQTNEQIEQCGSQRQELEYRLVPQEIKKRSGTEAGRSGEYVGGEIEKAD